MKEKYIQMKNGSKIFLKGSREDTGKFKGAKGIFMTIEGEDGYLYQSCGTDGFHRITDPTEEN